MICVIVATKRVSVRTFSYIKLMVQVINLIKLVCDGAHIQIYAQELASQEEGLNPVPCWTECLRYRS